MLKLARRILEQTASRSGQSDTVSWSSDKKLSGSIRTPIWESNLGHTNHSLYSTDSTRFLEIYFNIILRSTPKNSSVSVSN